MPWNRGADVAEGTCEIKTSAGVQLADVISVNGLPGRGVFRRGIEGAGVARVPFRLGHEGIDTAGGEVHADAIPGAQTRETASGEGFGRGI